MTVTVAAVDLGASSGRVVLGRTGPGGVTLEEVHRFPNVPVRSAGRLRWDIHRLYDGVLTGLRAAQDRAGRLDSVGVDSWAVDYGVLDAQGELRSDPICYRDPQTDDAVASVLAEPGAAELYEQTGTQLQPFNTLFQLLAHHPPAGSRALLIPDLVCYWLTGRTGTEVTNASTTQLFDPRAMAWSASLAERAGIAPGLFAPLRRPGERLGRLRPELGLGDAEVITVPSHDTAAAVAGIPAAVEDFAYVCTGTWALVGVELPAPVIDEPSRRANFTNEVGTDATIRFLRNVTGFWLVQECVRDWGGDVDLGALTEQAERLPLLRSVIDVQDPSFARPGEMPRRISDAARAVGSEPLSDRAAVIRCILDSMALAIRDAVRDAVRLSGRAVSVVHVVGGGVSNELFCQLVADACELPVEAGPVEAASWGNVMTQLRTLGAVDDSLAASRALIRRADAPRIYRPRGDAGAWTRAAKLLADVRG